MGYDESNSHVTDDITRPRKVKAVNPVSQKRPDDTDLVPMEHLQGRSKGAGGAKGSRVPPSR